ncbi:MAG: aryl-sulfate sulfotransferase [Myxococcota bacterium]
MIRWTPVLLALVACGPIGQVEGEVAEAIPTAINVSWTTAAGESSWVEFGPDENFGYRTATDTSDSSSRTATLVGNKPETDVYFRVVHSGANGERTSATQVLTTGALPRQLPSLTVEGTNPGVFVSVTQLGSATGPLILDPDGTVVWYTQFDEELEVYRASPLMDGSGMVFNAGSVSGDPAENSRLIKVSWDGADVTEIDVPFLAHDFVEIAPNTFGAIAVEYREVEGEQVRGDSIVEVSPDGTVTTVWSAWDCFDPIKDNVGAQEGWTFANALRYFPEEDAYYLGKRNFSSITKIPRADFSCEWTFGDVAADFKAQPATARFRRQHQFDFTPDGKMLVFDNDGPVEQESRILQYDFDPVAQTATLDWQFTGPFTFVLGDVHYIDVGDTFVTWGAAGQMQRLNSNQEVTFQANTAIGDVFGFSLPLSSLYPGLE